MSTQRIIGLVTGETGRFICRTCHAEVEMVAVIDQRNVKAKVWLEVSEHHCPPIGIHPNCDSVVDANGDYFWDVVTEGAPPRKGPKS